MQTISCELQLETPQMTMETNRECRLRGLLGGDWTERDVRRPRLRTRISLAFLNQKTHTDMNPPTMETTRPDGREQAKGA